MERLMGRNKELVIVEMSVVFLDGFVPRHDAFGFRLCEPRQVMNLTNVIGNSQRQVFQFWMASCLAMTK